MPDHLPPPLYGLDIETDTAIDGLDPRVSRVLAVAVVGPGGTTVLDDADEARLLDRLDWLLAGLEPGVVVTWNGAAFDLPFLADRAAHHRLALGLRLALDPGLAVRRPTLPGHDGAYRAAWHGHAHLDAYRLFRADVIPALGCSGSLKTVARVCGLEPVETDAARVHELGRAELGAYVRSDAACTRELVARRWPTARAAVDRLPRTLPGALPGAVTSSLLRARARAHLPTPRPPATGRCGARALTLEAVR